MKTAAAAKTMLLAATVLAVTTTGRNGLSVSQAFKLAAPASSRHHGYGTRTSSPSPRSLPSTPYASMTSTLAFHQQFKRRRRGDNFLVLASGKGAIAEQTTATESATATKNNDSPSLKTNRNEKIFQNRLAELLEFRSQHGHGSIPTPYPENPSLGIWAANLRRQYALWKRASEEEEENNEQGSRPYIGYLNAQRRNQLLSAGFDFTSLTERQFQTRLVELEKFKEKYGHCMVPEKWEENLALGAWVSNLRSLYKRRRTSQKTKQQLQSASQLKLEQEGGADNYNNKKRKQRRSKNMLLQLPAHPKKKRTIVRRSPRFSHLDRDRIKLLEDMGFVWSSNGLKWFEMLEWAKVYGVVNHQLKMSDGNATLLEGGQEQQAGMVTEELNNKMNNTLFLDNYHTFVHDIQDQTLLPSFHPQDRILPLLFLGEESGAQNGVEPSNIAADLLQSFQPSHLDYGIPPNDALHQPLRIWMINQRSNYNRLNQEESDSSIPSTMTPQRQKSLEEIHFPWSGRFPNRIEEVQYEKDQLAIEKRQVEKVLRIERKEQEERELVERVLSKTQVDGGDEDDDVDAEENVVDIMALWDAEDDDEDDW